MLVRPLDLPRPQASLADRLESWERYDLLTSLFVGEPTPEEWLLEERCSVLRGDPVPAASRLPEGDRDSMMLVLETLAAGAASTSVHLAMFATNRFERIEHIDECLTCSEHARACDEITTLCHGLGRQYDLWSHHPAEPYANSGWSLTYRDCCGYGRLEREQHDAAECAVRTCPPCRLDISLLIGIWDTFHDVMRWERWSGTADRLSAAIAEEIPIRLMLDDVPWRGLVDGTYSRGRWANLLYRDTLLRGRSPLAGNPDLRYDAGRLGVNWAATRRVQADHLWSLAHS